MFSAQKSMDGVKSEDKIRECPDCGNKDIDHKGEEYFCKKCGLVFE